MGNIEDEHLTIKQLVCGGEQKVAGTTGRWSYFQAKTNVKLGGWYNASKSYMDCDATGSVTGLMSAHNMELRLPNYSVQWGAYTVAEHNLVLQASTNMRTAGFTSFGWYRVSGDSGAITTWEDDPKACFFKIEGLTAGNNSIYDTQGPASADAGLKIIIGTTVYYIMLSTTPT